MSTFVLGRLRGSTTTSDLLRMLTIRALSQVRVVVIELCDKQVICSHMGVLGAMKKEAFTMDIKNVECEVERCGRSFATFVISVKVSACILFTPPRHV